MALECSCLAAGAVGHPGGFRGSALINSSREPSAQRPQQLRPAFSTKTWALCPHFPFSNSWHGPAGAYALPSTKHPKASSRVEMSQRLVPLPGVSAENGGGGFWSLQTGLHHSWVSLWSVACPGRMRRGMCHESEFFVRKEHLGNVFFLL